MRDKIKEFLCLSQEEKTHLWDTADFVFDTNVLLDLYRYTKSTRETLLNAITSLKDRIHLPYHIAYEFMKNRCDVLLEAATKYSNLEKDSEEYIKKIQEALRLEDNDKNIRKLHEFILLWLKERQTIDIAVIDPQNDSILDTILDIFEGKVGDKYSDDEFQKLCSEGEERYKKRTPPGFKDKSKPENGYGDYIIWSQIIDYSKKKHKDVIFVTRDLKDDWWLIIRGRKISPLVELTREFILNTKQTFYMYNIQAFLEHYNGENNEAKEAISEVERIAFENSIKNRSSNHNFERIKTIQDEELSLDSNIKQVEQKIHRQKEYINRLINKYPAGNRPMHIQDLINKTEAKVNLYQSELTSLKTRIDNTKKYSVIYQMIENFSKSIKE